MSNNAKVVVVTFASVAKPRSGGSTRMRAAIDDLSALGVEVTVLSIGEPQGNHIPSNHLPIRLIAVPRTSSSSFSKRNWIRTHWLLVLARQIRSLEEKPDVILLCSAMFMPSVLIARWRGKLVLDNGEIETLHYQRLPKSWSNRWRKWIWRLLESYSTNRAEIVVAIGQSDEIAWAKLFPRCAEKLVVVEHRHWSQPVDSWADQSSGAPHTQSIDESLQPRLIFLGNMLGKHNLVAVEWIYSTLVVNLDVRTEILLIGPGTEKFPQGKFGLCDVITLGEVEHFEANIRGNDIGLAPIEAASGVKTKVLDYLKMGLLVVGTPVAFEGIESCPELIPTDLSDFPARIHDLLQNPELPSARTRRVALQRAWSIEHDKNRTIQQWGTVLDRLFSEST